ncbi:hypothetical protein OF83DRAFT_1091849 [Amylostereum chailletii]|nr:hypothetical protein OF83DRAFT_1091849 [Amylostereum chailletii]
MPPQASSSKGPVSPISQLLHGLGMTRDDLTRHSDQMRQFLVTENAGSLRALIQEPPEPDIATTPTLAPAQSRPKSRSYSVSDASVAAHQTPPPITPIKSEPVEPVLSARRFDSMEEVIERQNRNKRRTRQVPEESPSPPPSSSRSVSRAPPRSHGRVSERAPYSAKRVTPRPSAPQPLHQDFLPQPLTPKAGRHYRDTVLYQSVPKPRGGNFVPRVESPSPSRTRRSSGASTSYRGISVDVSTAGHDAQSPLPSPRLVDDIYPPITPRRNQNKTFMVSSSPATGSSFSSPARPVVNIVSSPGPMGSEDEDDDHDKLPFKLPPGPYSPVKPDLPYAALIGQAILASPQHRLTLQEIYHYITIVWPHFKRNEQTWMNSIRHVLSTTMVFRKVQRDRIAGRTLWAIFDQDLDCFTGGGFRKELCADMEEQKANYVSRKRAAEKPLSRSRKTKRSKKVMQEEASQDPLPPMGIPLSSVPSISFAPPLFPPPRPGTHHQPYYTPYPVPAPPSMHPHTLPAGVIFPPLPPNSAYHRLNLAKPTSDEHTSEGSLPGSSSSRPVTPPPSQSEPESYLVDMDSTETTDITPSPTLIPASSSASSTSVPPLTPNNSSSSPPEPVEEAPPAKPAKKRRTSFDLSAWLVSPAAAPLEVLAPGITLLDHEDDTLPTVKPRAKSRKGKGKPKPSKMPQPPRAPESPTLMRQAAKSARLTTPPRSLVATMKPFVTPPSRAVTPPRKSSGGHQMSAMRTPLSHLGVHMSPSPSLAHYKSNLNPPPSFSPPADGEHLHTPSYHRNPLLFTPSTPHRLLYPFTQDSPFRTPGRGILDPHDPSTLLDEELARLGAQGNSPQSLFVSAPGLMYESPCTPSGRLGRLW